MLFRTSVFLLVANLLCILAKSDENVAENELDTEFVNYPDEVSQRGLNSFPTSSRLRKRLEKLLKEMPTGWPEHNIPPLAPYTKQNLTVNYENDYFTFYQHLERFQIFNLDKMKINVLKNKLFRRRIDFDFTFPNITAVGELEVDSLVDLSSILGVSQGLKANSAFKFGFENLRLNGSFHYKAPIIFGSVSIHDLQISLGLDGMKSQLSGVINSQPITKQINNVIVKQVLAQFNRVNNNAEWFLERLLETQINRLLVGEKIWDY